MWRFDSCTDTLVCAAKPHSGLWLFHASGVAIGRAVIHRPPLIIADEPTGNLDSKSGANVLELIRTFHEAERPTIVMATHSDAAAAFGDYTVHLADGRITN